MDCAGKQDPDLKTFKNLHHEYILFDEASTQMVLKYKTLFQASASWVLCGSSGTNIYAYMVWLHRVNLIVASNSWMDEIQQLPVTDAQWLTENSVYIAVKGPLWLSSEEPLAQDIVLPTTQSVLGMDL